jgi:hypothetical protein
MKIDPDSIILGLLASKVLRLGEQKVYIIGGIIGIGREREGGGRKIRSLISETTRKNIKKNKKSKINNNIILPKRNTRLYKFLFRIYFK